MSADPVPATLKHVWYADGTKEAEVALDIKYPSMRIWSSKSVRPGSCKVEAVDDKGPALSSKEFTVAKESAPVARRYRRLRPRLITVSFVDSAMSKTPSDNFDAWDPKIQKEIDDLIALAGPPVREEDNRDLVRQMIVTALKVEHSQLDRGDAKILSRAMRELRYGFRIFKDYRDKRKVTIFGSARTPKDHPEYKQALAFSKLMAKHGFMAITGAGPGIMKAGNEGAGKNNSFGINIKLPLEQTANEFIGKDPRFIDCRFFFTRKLMFLKETARWPFSPGASARMTRPWKR